MKITRLEPQKRNPTRCNVYLDGEFALGLSAETLLRYGLRVGDEIAPDTRAAIEKTEEQVNARASALRFLSVRPRTVREVRDKLREKEFGDEEIALAIRTLTEAGLLDDLAFAKMYVRDAQTVKPAGAMLLKKKLLLLGVEKAVIEQALQEEMEGFDVRGAAEKIAREFLRKSKALRPDEPRQKLRARVAAFLGRRGYGWDVIDDVLRGLLAGEEEE